MSETAEGDIRLREQEAAMAELLVRDLPDEDLETLRSAAEAEGCSLDDFLRDLISCEAARLRTLQTLSAVGGQPPRGLPHDF